MKHLAPSLPAEVWQTLYAVLMGQRPPFHVERQAVQAFEAAIHAAQQPPKPTDGISDG